MSEQEQRKAPGSFRTKIVLLAIIFMLPLGYALYLKLTEWRPATTTNYGQLVIPPVSLKDSEMQSIDGKPISLKDFQHHWLMVTFGKNGCDEACDKNLYKMRQTHIAQGKYQMRVKRLLVLDKKPPAEDLARFEQYRGMTIVTGPERAVSAFAKQFKFVGENGISGRNEIYLVDPLGNFMMRYDAVAEAGGIRKDLGRLLRVSRIG